MSVVLPDPFGPRIAVCSRLRIVNVKPSRAAVLPFRTVALLISSRVSSRCVVTISKLQTKTTRVTRYNSRDLPWAGGRFDSGSARTGRGDHHAVACNRRLGRADR